MNEKEEVLRQISEIKSHLIDKETFFLNCLASIEDRKGWL